MTKPDEALLEHVREMDEGTRAQLVLGISGRIDALRERKQYAAAGDSGFDVEDVGKQLEEAKLAEQWLVELVRLWVIANA